MSSEVLTVNELIEDNSPSLAFTTHDFVLPKDLEAHEPPEARGLKRDEVRLMVTTKSDDSIKHTEFKNLVDYLEPSDVLVINTSATLAAAIPARRPDGTDLMLHLSTCLADGSWMVELRLHSKNGTQTFRNAQAKETLELPGGATATLLSPYPNTSEAVHQAEGSRLWLALLDLPVLLSNYLAAYGKPIRYSYVPQDWDLSYYQTVFANEAGSAEMPSAGRAFSAEMITALVAKGVAVAPLVLHTGVASLEAHEPPYKEYYRVPAQTARLVNHAHEEGKRVIAVGTTVVRALETATNSLGVTQASEGYTKLLITSQHQVKAVDGMLTGWHEPKATHLAMLEAIAGREHLEIAYQAALENRYLWHEFGDLHLILP